jgi:hypothetical protein
MRESHRWKENVAEFFFGKPSPSRAYSKVQMLAWSFFAVGVIAWLIAYAIGFGGMSAC